MSARIQVIGDEVWADGYRVATLVTAGVPATVNGAFRTAMTEPEVRERYEQAQAFQRRNRSDD